MANFPHNAQQLLTAFDVAHFLALKYGMSPHFNKTTMTCLPRLLHEASKNEIKYNKCGIKYYNRLFGGNNPYSMQLHAYNYYLRHMF